MWESPAHFLVSVAGALAAIDVKDLAGHEIGLELEDRVNNVGDLAHMADRVQFVADSLHAVRNGEGTQTLGSGTMRR